jgi:hypothetical protein
MLTQIPAESTNTLTISESAATREFGLLLSFDDVITDRNGVVCAPDRLLLLRLFHALGGPVAVFSALELPTLDRALGLPDLPLIGGGGGQARLARDLAITNARGVEALLDALPFTSRPLLLVGMAGAEGGVLEAVGRRRGQWTGSGSARATLAALADRLMPTTCERRTAA